MPRQVTGKFSTRKEFTDQLWKKYYEEEVSVAQIARDLEVALSTAFTILHRRDGKSESGYEGYPFPRLTACRRRPENLRGGAKPRSDESEKAYWDRIKRDFASGTYEFAGAYGSVSRKSKILQSPDNIIDEREAA